uniref:Uncharacterized protein n=1 Tax=Anopheles farauti TaxID=69004 RepID=A0A182PZI7_9DIPT
MTNFIGRLVGRFAPGTLRHGIQRAFQGGLLRPLSPRQFVRGWDVDDLRRLLRRLRYRLDPGETLQHELALQLAEPLFVDVEANLERSVAQQEPFVLDRRLVLRLQILRWDLAGGELLKE